MHKWVAQKLNPMIEETPAVRTTLTSTDSRNGSNRARKFKDFAGGQLYIEHAGSPSRLKSTTVRTLIVDELTNSPPTWSAVTTRWKCSTAAPRHSRHLQAPLHQHPADPRPLAHRCPLRKAISAATTPRARIAAKAASWNGPACAGVRRHRRRLRLPRMRRHDRRAPQAGHDRRRPLGGRNPGAKIRGYHINALYCRSASAPLADLVEMAGCPT